MNREIYYRILHTLAGIAIGYWLFYSKPKVEHTVIEIPTDFSDCLNEQQINYYDRNH
jgi:hypothetical protein